MIQVCFLFFAQQTEILINDNKYREELNTYYASLYLIVFNYDFLGKSDASIFDKRFNNRRMKQLKELMKYENISKKDIEAEFEKCIYKEIPVFYDFDKVKIIMKNI